MDSATQLVAERPVKMLTAKINQRLRKTMQVEAENKKFLTRLQSVTSSYNIEAWSKERKKQEKLLKHKC